MTDIIDALRAAGKLGWFEAPPRDPSEKNHAYAPIVLWRWRNPREVVERVLTTTLEKFRGKVEWELRMVRRNWVLAPVRVRQFKEKQGVPLFGEAVNMLAELDPEFGQKANEDIVSIAKELTNEFSDLVPQDPFD